MRRGLGSFALCLLLAVSMLLPFTGGLRGSESAGVSTLKRLVHAYPDSAILHARLGLLVFATGTAAGRTQAIGHMNRAIQLEPDNADFRLILAEMYLRRGQLSYGTDELRRLLEIHPEHSLARCRLGKAYLKRAIEEWDHDWFARAADELSKVNVSSPVYHDARKQLALCYYDLGMPDSSAAVLADIPSDSLDVEALLILGMSLSASDAVLESFDVFSRALGAMEREDRDRFASLECIAATDELELMAAAAPADLAALMEDLWKRRDPNPATRVNERFVEHLARVAFADVHFSVPGLNKRGSQTARGEVYIRCGRPLAWVYDPFGDGLIADTDADAAPRAGLPDHSIPPSPTLENLTMEARAQHKNSPIPHSIRRWTWQYAGFVIDFEDRFLNNDFTFPYEDGWGSVTPGYYMEQVPEVYELQIRKRMNVVLDALNLLGPGGKPYLKVVYGCDTRGLERAPGSDWPGGDFEVEVALLDSSYADVHREAMEVELVADSAALHQTLYPLIGIWRTPGRSGRALAAVSLKSRANEAVGFTKKEIDIPQVGDSLWVSDIEVRFREEEPPNPTHVYSKPGQAYMAFGVCNVLTDQEGIGELEIGYMLTRKRTSPGLLERLARFISGGSETDVSGELTSLWSVYSLRISGGVADEVIGIDLSPFSAGDYTFAVRASDRLSGRAAVSRTSIRIQSRFED